LKYQCLDCTKKFIFPTKKTVEVPTIVASLDYIKEEYVCPKCGSFEFDEYKEPEEQIESVVTVDIPDVDLKLKEGYVVKQIYQKNVVMIKTKKETKKVDCK